MIYKGNETITPLEGPANIAAQFFSCAETFADLPAVGMSGEDAYLSYRQLATRVRECLAVLQPLVPGQPVGLLSENRPEWGKAYFAILAGGGRVVPVDSSLKESELARVLTHSRVEKLLVSPRFYDLAAKARDLLDHSLELIDLEGIPAGTGESVSLHMPDDGNRPAVIIFTSGTTGSSKKVILTHGNILKNIEGMRPRFPFGPGDCFLSVLPLHHTLEATCGFILPLIHGCAVYYVRELNSREILNGIKKHQPTHLIAVPLIFEKMYRGILDGVKKAPVVKRTLFNTLLTAAKTTHLVTGRNPGKKLFGSFRKAAGFDSLEVLVSGGAPLDPQIARGFHRLGFNFIEGYGLTETSPVVSVNPVGKVRYGSVGPPLPNVEARIDSPDDKGVGELVVRGAMTTPGYEDNPEETAKLLRDGWLFTGDMARIDEDGYIYIMGRMKNVIVSAAGKNIYPEEIENVLHHSPFIQEVMVYGHKVPSGREEVAALIYPDFAALSERLEREPEKITDDEVREVIGREVKAICTLMADFKRVKHIRYTREEMEKTSTRKIKRYLYANGNNKDD